MAKNQTVIIGCRLPHGITLQGIDGPVVLNGENTALIPGAPGLTHVDQAQAAYLSATYEDYAPFKSNAIFVSESAKVADAVAIARELTDEKTGFEGINPDAPAPGLTPESDVDKAREAAERAGRPSKAPTAPIDKEAASELAGNL